MSISLLLQLALIVGSAFQHVVTFKHNVTTQYADENYVEFVGDETIYNEAHAGREERYRLTVQLIDEAHQKFKFTPGVVYINNADKNVGIPSNLYDKHMYYVSYDTAQHSHYDKVAGPGFTFLAWPSAEIYDFTKEVEQIMEASKKPAMYNKIGWVGNKGTSKNRRTLCDIGDAHKDIFNFTHFPAHEFLTNSSRYVSLHKLTEYFAYTIDLEGHGYSGRLKYLLYSNRPVFLVQRQYGEYFNADLRPMEHYIPVNNDLSNLIAQYNWAVANPDKVKEIAANALKYATEHFSHEVCMLFICLFFF